MDKRKVIAAVLIILVLFYVSLIVVLKIKHTRHCELSNTEPKYDADSLINIESQDWKALVNFDGYFKYERVVDGKDTYEYKGFMPLKLIDVEHHSSTNESEGEYLDLDTTCATIRIELMSQNKVLKVTRFVVRLVLPDGLDDHCIIRHPEVYFDPIKPGTHYECKKIQLYPCSSETYPNTNPVGFLAINAFEFELNGIPNMVEQGKFSTVSVQCR